mmetsp:Transcript_12209/g.39066  ORF Transcript_12209/g.39066 Transcript_12209/m.39066 type:complete len:82 (-) Transcript_12209:291-536(-)
MGARLSAFILWIDYNENVRGFPRRGSHWDAKRSLNSWHSFLPRGSPIRVAQKGRSVYARCRLAECQACELGCIFRIAKLFS